MLLLGEKRPAKETMEVHGYAKKKKGTLLNTLPCRIKTTSVAFGMRETVVGEISQRLTKRLEGGLTSLYFVQKNSYPDTKQ